MKLLRENKNVKRQVHVNETKAFHTYPFCDTGAFHDLRIHYQGAGNELKLAHSGEKPIHS